MDVDFNGAQKTMGNMMDFMDFNELQIYKNDVRKKKRVRKTT